MKIWTYDEMKGLEPCVDVMKEDIESVHDVARKMIEICITKGGVGLAAPQVGMNANMFIYSPDGVEYHMVFNPQWFPEGSKKTKSIEQCLSLPQEDYYYVERYKYINVIYYSLAPSKNALKKVTRRLRKEEAIIFQHESDHLKGITLIESGVKM